MDEKEVRYCNRENDAAMRDEPMVDFVVLTAIDSDELDAHEKRVIDVLERSFVEISLNLFVDTNAQDSSDPRSMEFSSISIDRF